ncbi:MAG: DinB family protein [Bacillota bacterium]|nr:DinB family protein [Bacillota bacterium]
MTPQALAEHLDGLFSNEKNGWHAPVTKALEGILPDLAIWRPSADLYSIWDVVNHMACEQQMVLHCVSGRDGWPEPFGPPGHCGYSNWPAPETGSGVDGWQLALNRLLEGHSTLVAAIGGLSADRLASPPPGRRAPLYKLIQGLIGHNSYHCGQIILLRRLRGEWTEFSPG